MSISQFPSLLDDGSIGGANIFPTITDNVTTIMANDVMSRSSAIMALEYSVGVTASTVPSSITYKLTHLPGQSTNWNMGAYTLTASQFLSTVSTGTAPLTVLSTTMVSNLNSQYLGGLSAPSAGGTAIVGTTDTQTMTNKTISGNISSLSSPLSVANGGTGSASSENGANGVVVLNGSAQLPAVSASLLTSIPAGNISGAIPTANGGTGATAIGGSAGQALYNVAPSVSGNSGKVLVTDGTSIYWGYPTYSS